MIRGMIRGYDSRKSNFLPLLKTARIKKRQAHIYMTRHSYCILGCRVHFPLTPCLWDIRYVAATRKIIPLNTATA